MDDWILLTGALTSALPPAIGVLSLAAWIYLVFAHGRFWLASERLGSLAMPATPLPVVAVVPARNEADVIERTLRSLLEQDYEGPFRVILVDDESDDGTSEVARSLASGHPRGGRFVVERTQARPPGWVGKMWAVYTGVELAREVLPEAEYLWLTDADVLHTPETLGRLVAKAESGPFDLVSLMVRLHVDTFSEKLLVPAFVYFFQKLYPFPLVNEPASRVAGAAGGCMLVRSGALAAAGGIAALRAEIIDDCALGRALQARGRLWLGLADAERSIRPYEGIAGVWQMVARSAYTQLGYSPARLVGTLVGLGLLYLAPPLLLFAGLAGGSLAASLLGGAAWLLMAASFVPMAVEYGRSPALGFALPIAGTLYALMTADSARRHYRSEGASWKGRVGAGHASAGSSPGRGTDG